MSWTCVQCGWLVEADDAITPTLTGRCFCVRCFAHVTGDERPVSKRLQAEIAALDESWKNYPVPRDPRITQPNGGA